MSERCDERMKDYLPNQSRSRTQIWVSHGLSEESEYVDLIRRLSELTTISATDHSIDQPLFSPISQTDPSIRNDIPSRLMNLINADR
jgi:hypothetical protein